MAGIPDSPAEFFTQVVPEQFSASIEGIDDGPGSICFDLVGTGQWSMSVSGGAIDVSEGKNEDTLVQVSFDGANWQEAAERMMSGGMGPLDSSSMAGLMSNPAAAGTLKAAQGTLKVVTQTEGGEEWVAVTFGGAEASIDAPRATLSMTQEVAEQLQSGSTNPQELFMSGKIQILGDMMMLMQLMPILQ